MQLKIWEKMKVWRGPQKTIENEYCLQAGKVILDCFVKVKKENMNIAIAQINEIGRIYGF